MKSKIAIQLDLFQEYEEIDILKKEIDRMDSTLSKVRRGLFSRYDELCKKYLALHSENEVLWVEIWKLKKILHELQEHGRHKQS